MMTSNNKQLILKYETIFAAKLASKVLFKPKLSSWMIFIPFIFIFYIQDLIKFKKGRKEFMANYLLSHEKALNEAEETIKESRKPDTATLAKKSGLKGKALEKYADLLLVLAEHYIPLLKADGDTYSALIKAAYSNNKTNLLLFFNQLGKAEKTLNKALAPKLKKSNASAVEIIKKMEKYSEILRREDIKDIYNT